MTKYILKDRDFDKMLDLANRMYKDRGRPFVPVLWLEVLVDYLKLQGFEINIEVKISEDKR